MSTLEARLELALSRDDVDGAARGVAALLRVAPARAAQVQRAAESALARDRPVLAARLFDAVPQNLADTSALVRALGRAGRLERAEAVLASAPPRRVGGPLGRARLYLELGLADRAVETADAALALEQGAQAWLVAGLAHLAAGHPVQAAGLLSRVPRGVRGFSEARVALAKALRIQGMQTLGGDVLDEALGGNADDEAALRRACAGQRTARGEWAAALDCWPVQGGVAPRAGRAETLERAGRTDEANESFRRLSPDDRALGSALRARVRAERLVGEGRSADAVGVLSARVARAAQDLMARTRLAELLEGEGQHDRAVDVATQALRFVTAAPTRRRLESVLRSGATAPSE